MTERLLTYQLMLQLQQQKTAFRILLTQTTRDKFTAYTEETSFLKEILAHTQWIIPLINQNDRIEQDYIMRHCETLFTINEKVSAIKASDFCKENIYISS